MPRPKVARDMFGFKIGSKKSEAAKLYMQPNGATLDDIKHELGKPQYNLLKEVAAQGHVVVKGGVQYGRTYSTKYTIIPKPERGGKLDFNNLTVEEMKEMGFGHYDNNSLIRIRLIPRMYHDAVPDGLRVLVINGDGWYTFARYKKKDVNGKEVASEILVPEVTKDEYGHGAPFRSNMNVRRFGEDYLNFGVLPVG